MAGAATPAGSAVILTAPVRHQDRGGQDDRAPRPFPSRSPGTALVLRQATFLGMHCDFSTARVSEPDPGLSVRLAEFIPTKEGLAVLIKHAATFSGFPNTCPGPA